MSLKCKLTRSYSFGLRLLLLILLMALLILVYPVNASADDARFTNFDFQSIPAFEEYNWIKLDDKPFFTSELLSPEPFVQVSPLDELGRTGAIVACLGPETIMSDYDYMLERISYKPSGWQNAIVPDFSWTLYECSVLIQPCLYPDLDVAENYFTETQAMSLEFFPFENGLYTYIRETGNHVLLRLTPYYEGSNLLCSGVLIEEWSIEDPPEKYSSTRQRAFAYNAQPMMIIDYSTGEAQEHDQGNKALGIHSILYMSPAENSGANNSIPAIDYVLNMNSKKFHYPDCASVPDIKMSNRWDFSGTRDEVIAKGYKPCGRCHP